MKRFITAITIAFAAILSLSAQDRLTVSVAVPEGIEHDNAAATLTSNLKQALVLNDAAADASRFVLKSKAAVLSKDVTNTAPAMFVTELEISLFITDTTSGDVMSQTSFTVKGIADSDKGSFMDAVKKVKARDPKLRNLINQAKNYFDEHIY